MTFKNLTMSSGTSFVAANGLSYCVFEDCDATVARKGIETAYFTHSSRVTRAKFRPMSSVGTNQMILFAAESAHRVLFEHCDVDVRGQTPTELGGIWGVGGFLGGTRYCRIRDSIIRADRYPRGYSFYGMSDNKPGHSNRMVRTRVEAGTKMAVSILSGGPKSGGHIVRNSKLVGREDSVLVGNGTTGCEVTDNRVSPRQPRNFGGTSNTVSGNTTI